METIIIALGFVLLSCLACYLFFSSKLKVLGSKYDNIIGINIQLKQDLDQERSFTTRVKAQSQELELKLYVLQEKKDQLNKKIQELLSDDQKREKQFEILANRIIQQQSKNLIHQQSKGMQDILDPLKERIKDFENKVEKSSNNSTRLHESLKEQIRHLSEKSEKVSQDANNLAKALKGDFKKQGNWGELILESILDKSGLEKNREYFTQVSLKDSNGKTQRPDVVIKLPDSKILIVDSKVSLSAYSKLVDAENEEKANIFRKAHLIAVKNHIDSLSAKNYHELYSIESPDFVLMFIPIDTAFTSALEADHELYSYAFDKNIVIVSSSTLLATLKTVESMWRNDKQNRYALSISVEAGKMYDKFVGFLKDVEKLGSQISTVQHTYNDSMKKLSSGTGNLIARAEKIRKLGAKASKRIQSSSFEKE